MAGDGYELAGYDVYAVDNVAKVLEVNHHPHLVADAMLVLEALVFDQPIGPFSDGRVLWLKDIDLIHASPPCQGFSIMNNLPWIRARKYPLLIDPVRALVKQTGKLYVIENVAGAASKRNLEKLGLLHHRLRAGWLCGGMFGLPIYRHRYFETNFFWPQPGHPKHVKTRQPESSFSPRPRGVWEEQYEAEHPGRSAQAAKVNTGWRAGHDGDAVVEQRRRSHLSEKLPGMHGKDETEYKGSWDRYKHTNPVGAASGKAQLRDTGGLTRWQLNNPGVGVGKAAGWRIAAEAMGLDLAQRRIRRYELTQGIPPVMTEHIAKYALGAVLS